MTKVAKVTRRILGLDFGEKRIGVAISDESQTIAKPLTTLKVKNLKEAKKEIEKITKESDVSKIVLGRPLNADGSLGFQYEEVSKFKKLISGLKIPIFWEDEFGTTLLAERRLKEKGLNLVKIKELVDSEAAAIILQGYLDRKK